MNGSSLVIDTNMALYLFNGDRTIASLLDGRNVYNSFITEIELLGFPGITNVQDFTSGGNIELNLASGGKTASEKIVVW